MLFFISLFESSNKYVNIICNNFRHLDNNNTLNLYVKYSTDETLMCHEVKDKLDEAEWRWHPT